MKKIAFLLFLTSISLNTFSQKTHKVMGWKIGRDIPANELKVNLTSSIFISYPEISYERILDSDIGIGAALGVSLQDEQYPIQFSFIPYFRWFFGGSGKSLDKYGSGFFIELNGAILSTQNSYENSSSSYTNTNGEVVYVHQTISSNNLGAGLGMAVGWKYLSKNNWIGEIYLGGGRNFTTEGGYPRLGISIGKRF